MSGEQLELAIPACLWCGKPATHACDAPIARSTREIKAKGVPLHFPAIHSCDLPMCAAHARRVGLICLGRPRRSESIDHCPYHARAMIPAPLQILSDAEAQALRDQIARGIFLDRDVGIHEPKT
jgi:hypothetical protein